MKATHFPTDRLILIICLLFTLGVFAVDVSVVPGEILPGISYAVAVLVAALYLRPRAVASVTVLALALEITASLNQHTPPSRMAELVFGLAAVGYLGAAMAAQRRRLAVLSVELRELYVREQAIRSEAETYSSQMSAVLESLAEGVTVMAPDGRVVLLNGVGRDLLWTCGGDGPQTLEDYRKLDFRRVDGSPLPPDELPIARALSGERFADLEVILNGLHGERNLAWSGSAVRDRDGRVLLAVAVMRDITQLRQLERAREEYVHAISHDLRQPLTVLLAHGMMLVKSTDESAGNAPEKAPSIARVHAGAASIVRAAERLNSMVQELAESARLEAGQLELDRTPVDLRQFVLELRDRMACSVDGCRLRVSLPEDLPSAVADPDRLERILTNLVTNALKYSEAEVTMSLERRDGEVVVAVEDRGKGIAAADLPHLFERYYRAEAGRRSRDSLGLGLYITRALVEAHGGRDLGRVTRGQGVGIPIHPADRRVVSVPAADRDSLPRQGARKIVRQAARERSASAGRGVIHSAAHRQGHPLSYALGYP